MNYDAVVWLLVGLGVGVAASLMLLIGYSALERGRLSRRLRRARAAAPVAAAAVTSMPVRVARPPMARPQAAKAEAEKVEPKREEPAKPEAKPAPKPEVATPAAVATEPAEPSGVVVPFAAPKPVEPKPPAVQMAPPGAAEKPAVKAPLPVTPPAPRKVQSVEAMFAEAFANDKLPGSKPEESPSKD